MRNRPGVLRRGRKAEQSEVTRARLLGVARELFATHGFAATGTEEIVARAGMTRGALYHQFRDKRELFEAVFEEIEAELDARVDASARRVKDPVARFQAGTRALLEASGDPAVQRIVLVDGPAVLGWERWRDIDSRFALGRVRRALQGLMRLGVIASEPVEPLAHLVVGALNEAALAIVDVAPRERREWFASVDRFVARIAGVS